MEDEHITTTKRIKAEEIKYKEDELIDCKGQRNTQAILVIDN
jgi:hypothetical protein